MARPPIPKASGARDVQTGAMFLTGAVLALLWRDSADLSAVDAAAEVARGQAPASALAPLPYPRLLRSARGVGRAKASDLADALWKLQIGLDELSSLPGIGPSTAASVRELLADRRISLHSSPAPSGADAYAGPGTQESAR